jgi:hypothetical protein
MSENRVSPFTHRALGQMLRLTLSDRFSFALTHQEARTLSRAMAAVAEGKSKVDEIFLSPIASDGDFSAKVTADGLTLDSVDPPLRLPWPAVSALSAALAAEAGPE